MRYIDSVLGYFWALMRPLLSFGIIFLFLRQILGFGGKIPNFAPMLMINIILFQFFQEATNQGMRALASKENLVRKMQFPRMVIPLTTSLTAAMTLVLNLVVGLRAAVRPSGSRPTGLAGAPCSPRRPWSSSRPGCR